MGKNESYEEFVEKYKPKKTTDDCYTPQAVYDEVLRFVGELTDLTGREIVRPFWPGGDYERYDYPENCIVVDNPPFSIYAKIVRFYLAHGIDFFLFAPALTQFVANAPVCHIVCMANVTYENGAVVPTSFTTNLVPGTRVWVNGTLRKRLNAVQPAGRVKRQKTVYPANVITAATMGKLAARGMDFKVGADQCYYIRRTDNMPKGKILFGEGLLLSERAAAERAAAELEDAFVIKLSEREMKMVELLNRQEAAK